VKNCLWCNTPFEPRRKDASCCSRKCAKARSAHLWRDANREKHREYSSNYYQKNQEACYKTSREWISANRGKASSYKRAWEARNPEASKRCKRNWELLNPAAMAKKAATRRAAKRNACVARGSEYHEFFMQEIYLTRQALSIATGVVHHVDHIVPLISKHVCGLHVPLNLRVIPWYENLSKGNRLIQAMGVAA